MGYIGVQSQSRRKADLMRPDPQLVYAAERIIRASNVHFIRKCLTWYTHWCRVGNKAGMEASEAILRRELQKAHAEERALRRTQPKAS